MADQDRKGPGDQTRASDERQEGHDLREPDNSTVDDWLGQRVGRDEERAERLLEQTGGDEAAAEQRFDEQSEAEEWHRTHEQG
jgi:hypothetical protein